MGQTKKSPPSPYFSREHSVIDALWPVHSATADSFEWKANVTVKLLLFSRSASSTIFLLENITDWIFVPQLQQVVSWQPSFYKIHWIVAGKERHFRGRMKLRKLRWKENEKFFLVCQKRWIYECSSTAALHPGTANVFLLPRPGHVRGCA